MEPDDSPDAVLPPAKSSRREYHRAYYWAHVERRREQARKAYLKTQAGKWLACGVPWSVVKHLLRR